MKNFTENSNFIQIIEEINSGLLGHHLPGNARKSFVRRSESSNNRSSVNSWSFPIDEKVLFELVKSLNYGDFNYRASTHSLLFQITQGLWLDLIRVQLILCYSQWTKTFCSNKSKVKFL